MVEMRNVRKIYDSSNTVALDGIDFSVEDGEFVFLVGSSGSGKSTIIKLITGEIRPTSGKIIVNDYDIVFFRKCDKLIIKLRWCYGAYRIVGI